MPTLPTPTSTERLRILDLSDSPAGGYAGRLLATHGIEVIKIEPPAGSGYRRRGPYAGDEVDVDRSLLSLYLDCSKRSVTVDLATERDLMLFERLLDSADGVITTDSHPTDPDMPSARRAPLQLHQRYPDLIVTSLTPFGLDGPYADLPSSSLVLEAMSGWLYQTGEPGAEPVRIRGQLASEIVPGLYAAIGTLAALRSGRRLGPGTPRGQIVEISALESLVAASRYFETYYAQYGEHIGRNGAMLFPFYGYTAALEGWTAPCAVTSRHVELLIDMMGRNSMPTAEEFAAWFAEHDREEIFHRGQAHRIPWGFLASAPEVLAHDHLRARHAFVKVEHPTVGSYELPGTADTQTIVGAGVERSPLLGEHNDQASSLLDGYRSAPATSGPASAELPLAGVRVIDITSWWAGPMAAMILADLGAEVIKIEAVQKMDAWRTTLSDPTSPTPWETSPLYNAAGRNKLSLTIDLTNPRGADLLRGLVAQSDLLIENMQPKVLPSLGLGYEALRAENPALIMVSQSGFGQTGPWRDYASLAQVGESLAGVGLITGREDGPPMIAGNFIGDPLSATHAAFAAIVALDEREGTGIGQHVDLSQLESTLPAVAEALLDYQLNGRTWHRIGNRSTTTAPHGCFPTLIDGEWMVLAVDDDDEWARLAREIDEPWATDPALATVAARLEAVDAIEAELLAWVVPQLRDDVTARLRALGLRVGPVQSPVEVLADPHLNHRGFFEILDRQFVGPLPYPGPGLRFSATPITDRRPAPLLGEHNRDVLSRVLGLDDSAITELEAAGVIGTEPVAPPPLVTMQ